MLPSESVTVMMTSKVSLRLRWVCRETYSLVEMSMVSPGGKPVALQL